MADTNPFREAFGARPPQHWKEALVRSCTESKVDGVAFPSFPDSEVQRTIQGNSQDVAIRGAFTFFEYVSGVAGRAGLTLGRDTRLLDFGSGWGRMVRPYMRDLDLKNIIGVEPSEEWCTIARRCNPHVAFVQSEYQPPLPFRDGHFDLVIAYSIFTHLPEAMLRAWMAEFERTVRPGGVIVFTFLGDQIRATLQRYPRPLPEDGSIHFWHRILLGAMDAEDGWRRYADGDFVFLPTHGHESYGDTLIPPARLRGMLQDRFDIVEVDASSLAQDVVALRRR